MTLPSRYQGQEIAARSSPPLSVELASEPDSDRLNLRALFSLLRRQSMVLTTIVGICVLLAFLITQNTTKLYTANADIVLKLANESITPGPDAASDDRPRGSEQIETEVQFIQSRDLASKVFDRLSLFRDETFVVQMRNTGRFRELMQTLGMQSPAPVMLRPGSVAADQFREAAINVLQSGLVVKRIGNSFALRISITNGDAQVAARLANGYARTYVGDQVATKVAGTQNAIGILRQRMEDLRIQAQTDFSAVQQYRISNSLQSKSGTSLTEQEISAYNQQVTVARAQSREDTARLAAIRSSGAASSPVVNALRGQRAALSIRAAELSDRYLPSHPDLISARQQLGDIDSQIAEEVARAIRTVQAEAQASSARLASLEGSLGGASGKLDTNNRALIDLDDLERKAAASQALYESYLNRYKEVVARSGAEQANAGLLSTALPPARPSSPNLKLNLALGLLIGLLVGAATAIIVEGAYSGFTTIEDVERRLSVRSFGFVPLLKSVDPHVEGVIPTIATYPGGGFAEAVRGVLAASRQSANSRNQVIAVTSAVPGEGKTTLSACLARTAAFAHQRVAIIDCDVVHRNLTLAYGTDDSIGLIDLFESKSKIEDVAPSATLGGALLLGIPHPFAAGERLLEQGRLHRIIAQLREQFDLIILDCAPILPIAETRDVVALADTVIVVTRWRDTADRVVRAALKMLPLHVIGDLGVVLNGVDLRKRLRFGDGDPEIFVRKYKNYYATAE